MQHYLRLPTWARYVIEITGILVFLHLLSQLGLIV
jgi:hypothetical protein